MKIEGLSEKLNEMYETAQKNEQVASIHLFGIKYGDIMKKNKYSSRKIIELAGLKKSYASELSKGVKLSKYVKII